MNDFLKLVPIPRKPLQSYSIKRYIWLVHRKRYLLFILLNILLLRAFNLPAKAERVTIRYENFTINYDISDEHSAQILLTTLQKVNPEFQDFFQVKIPRFVEIYLPHRPVDFYQSTPTKLPVWAQGVYLTENRRIILKKTGWMNVPEELGRVLAHEMSHLYLSQRLSGIRIPVWFNEGLAEYLSGARLNISQGVILANALFARQWLDLTEVDSMSSFSESQARLAYIESLSAVLHLGDYIRIKGLNWSKYFNIIKDVGFNAALEQVTGQDFIDFEIKWYRTVKEKYQWFIIFNWENIIWLLMILVLLGAMYAVRYRNRQVLLKWQQEESILANHINQT